MYQSIMDTISLWTLPLIIILILTMGLIKKIPVYEVFTEGAKEGFKVSINIIPYLVAIIVAISMLRSSGIIDITGQAIAPLLSYFNIPSDIIPIMVVRSLSGSAALGIFSDIAHKLGTDNYATTLAAVMVGSSETTFYILSVYFGAVGIKKLRYALLVGLMADAIGILAAITVCNLMFK